ncbi:MAG: heme A synthase [Bacteroidetes bacterium]|nr:MAG: heme A synthase [Bacteroidota bacterium]MCB0802373.1 COX15/CtaA family protein [Flavobacteriales bacterium]
MNNTHRPIVIWLFTGCLLIFLMVAIGGLTRLTHSGLSMVEWTIFGSTPPHNEDAWHELFDKYKDYPEYKLVNFDFSLDEFKSIFYWEYGHRMLGRLLGFVFIIPFFWFLYRKKISKDLLPKLILLLFMGGFQGFLGWYMVKSGLVSDPDVSHYRLAMHLVTAFLTFAYTFWIALDLIYPVRLQSDRKIKKLLWVLLPILIIQIIWGAYVAGLNAGWFYNTWPKMDNNWIAEGVTAMSPVWKNFVEGIAGVQFVHRYLAYVVVALILIAFFRGRKIELELSQRKSLNILVLMVAIQFILGVFALLFSVPVVLGLLHQLGAFMLLGATVFAIHQFHGKSI